MTHPSFEASDISDKSEEKWEKSGQLRNRREEPKLGDRRTNEVDAQPVPRTTIFFFFPGFAESAVAVRAQNRG